MARLTKTITQGGADAFVQDTITTALEGQTRQAYQINEIQLEFANAGNIFRAVANMDIELCITRRSKVAMPELTDVDVIKKWSWSSEAYTGVGQSNLIDKTPVWNPAGTIIVVEDPLYAQLDSTATGLTLACNIVIDYDIVTISDIDRLTLLTQSLV